MHHEKRWARGSTSWIKIARRNINNLRYAMTPHLWQKIKNQRASWWSERGEWKNWLKAQHSEKWNHGIWSHQFSSVQSLSHVQLFATLWIAAHQASLSITISRSSLRLTSIESVMPSSHPILSRPLLLLPPIPPSIRVFSSESTLRMRWPKY